MLNKFIPILSIIVNNRDRTKITVIDGHTAFTGGINLADEYINEIVKVWPLGCFYYDKVKPYGI